MPWNRILIAYDDSDLARKALDYVILMFSGCAGAEVILAHIHERVPDHQLDGQSSPFVKEVAHRIGEIEQAREKAAGLLEEARRKLVEAGFPPDGVRVVSQPKKAGVARDLSALIAETGAGTVVAGRQGHSRLKDAIFGSTAEALINNLSGVTVVVVG